jgi:hypothetical protein
MKKCMGLAFVVFASCVGHVTGDLQIDGEPFAATSCRPGRASGFYGIELSDDHGRRLRLAENLDGTLASVYFPPGSRIGDNLGTCGTLNFRLEGAAGVKGSVTLTCKSEKHQLSGRALFEHCR